LGDEIVKKLGEINLKIESAHKWIADQYFSFKKEVLSKKMLIVQRRLTSSKSILLTYYNVINNFIGRGVLILDTRKDNLLKSNIRFNENLRIAVEILSFLAKESKLMRLIKKIPIRNPLSLSKE